MSVGNKLPVPHGAQNFHVSQLPGFLKCVLCQPQEQKIEHAYCADRKRTDTEILGWEEKIF